MRLSLTSRMTGKTMSLVSLIALLMFLPLLLLAVYQTATIISRAAGKQASIVVDLSSISVENVDPTFMHAFTQGGEQSGNWLYPVQKEVAALNPKWIRIDHVFDFYTNITNDGGVFSFDFSRLDEVLDSIAAVGATPVISLSYMPPAIAKDNNVTNPPVNWDDWSLVVQKTIEHISGTSTKNISDIYYEVWNEPDHEQFGGWKLDGDKNYLTLYQYAAKGASQAKQTQRFFLGGPVTTGLYNNWIVKLVESKVRLDFLSWHMYADDPWRFSQDQKNISSWLMSYPEAVLLPKLITKYGFTGTNDGRYNTSFGAAYTAAVFRELASSSPKGLFTFQLKNGPGQKIQDGLGLISHESQGKTLKPRYHIFSFLDLMTGTRIPLAGEGTWVKGIATKQDRSVRVLLVNFDATGSHTETVPVAITNLLNGVYTYRLQYLDEMQPKNHMSQEETISNGTFSKQIFMPAQSVLVIEITKTLSH